MATTRLDTTLASNFGTRWIPRLDLAVGHGLKYLVQQWAKTASQIFKGLGQMRPVPNLSPPNIAMPGNARRMSDAPVANTPPIAVPTLRCAETGRQHPVLPADQYNKMLSYGDLQAFVGCPTDFIWPDERFSDAFRMELTGPDGTKQPFLPPSLMQSSLLNSGLRNQIEIHDPFKRELDEVIQEITACKNALEKSENLKNFEEAALIKNDMEELDKVRVQLLEDIEAAKLPGANAPGNVQAIFPNTLFDPHTGFTAAITVRKDNEVVINFGAMNSQNAGWQQGIRSGLNILGATPQKNFAQASQLTQIMQKRIAEVNKLRGPNEKLTLKLSGHSMGGGMATYAALRNNVKAVVFSPLRLGLLTRAKVGRPALKNAPKLVTEVVVQNDWVADSARSRLWGLVNYAPSLLLTGRRPDAWGAIGERYMLPEVEGLNPHSAIVRTIRHHAANQGVADNSNGA